MDTVLSVMPPPTHVSKMNAVKTVIAQCVTNVRATSVSLWSVDPAKFVMAQNVRKSSVVSVSHAMLQPTCVSVMNAVLTKSVVSVRNVTWIPPLVRKQNVVLTVTVMAASSVVETRIAIPMSAVRTVTAQDLSAQDACPMCASTLNAVKTVTALDMVLVQNVNQIRPVASQSAVRTVTVRTRTLPSMIKTSPSATTGPTSAWAVRILRDVLSYS